MNWKFNYGRKYYNTRTARPRERGNLSIGTLFKFYLKFGGEFMGPLNDPTQNNKLKLRLLKDRVKRQIS